MNRTPWTVLPVFLLGLAFAFPLPPRAEAAPGAGLTPQASEALRANGRAVLWVYFGDKGETDAASLRRALVEAGNSVSPSSRARRARGAGGRFEPDYTDIATPARYVRAVEAAGGTVRHVSRWLNAASVEVNEAGARRIAALPFVREITAVRSSEPQYGPPGSYGGTLTQNQGVNSVAAHDSGYSAARVVVAVFDTGFRKDHAALAPLKRIAEWDFVGSDGETANQVGEASTQWSHGTGVWSILGGYLPGSMVGPAFNASFILAKTKDVTATSTVDEDRWVAAAQWADSIGVDVVQSSMVVSYPAASLNGRTTPMALATNILSRHGVLVVTAMGNTGPGATTMWTPSDCDSILAVGSVTSANVISTFSSRGPTVDGRGKPDLVAQGENTIWATPNCIDCLGTYPGTSLAAPLVSGVAALVQEAHPEWSAQQIRYALKSTADKAGSPDSTTYGWGRPDAVAAIYASSLGGPIFPKPFPLVAPAADASSVGTPITFQWRRAKDLNPGDAVSYTLEIRRVSPNVAVFSTSAPDTAYLFSGALDPGTQYEWNVVATDLGGHARPCHEPFRFTTSGGGGGDQPPAVTAPATAGGPENALVAFGVTASDPDGQPLSALTAAPLPSGASFAPNGSNTSGTFSWTPTYAQGGVYNIVFTAANALTGTAATAITVTNVNRPPTLDPIAAITVNEGAIATRALVASDPDGDALTYSKLSGPGFATVSGATLTVSPGYTDAGSHSATVRASDGSLNSDQSVAITVNDATQPPPPAANLVGAWAFDENGGSFTADASGNGFTGTLTNNPAWVAGKYGSALSFNATDDGNDANDPKVALGQTINVPNLPFTFSVWVNPASYADWRAIFSKRNSPSASNMRCDVGLSKTTGRLYVSTGSTTRTFTYAPPLNAWTHVAVVAEATGTKLYVGGVLNQTLTAVTLGTGTTASTAIGGTGSGPGGNDDPYKGLLDDVRLYSRALTAAEITADMNTPAGAPDTEFPTVSLTAPAAGTVSGTVSVTADASDNVVVAGVQFRLDGAALGAEDTAAPYAVSWNTLTASNGSHALTAVARDAAGNTTTSGSVTVTVSNPPTLTITAPAAGSTVVGTTVPVSYAVSGDLTGVDHVHFQLDANPIVMDLSLDGSYQLANVAAGSHVLNGFLVTSAHVKIPGTDAAPVSFTTTVPDTVFPTVSLTAPSAGATVSGTITVTADASDNLGVAGVQFRVGTTNLLPEDTTAPYSVVFNTATVANGVHSLTAVARDAAGNSTTSAPLSITVDNVSPSDPSVVGQWSGPVGWPNNPIHASLLYDGTVLTWGKFTDNGGVNVWNPTTNTFVNADYPAANLFCAYHTALPDGRILVNGGHISAYVGLPATAIFSPATRTWTTGSDMAYARWYPTTITLPDGRVLTVSGAINCPTCISPGHPDAGIAEYPEIYDPATNVWTTLTGAQLNLPIYPHLFVLPADGRILATSTHEGAIPTYVLDLNTQTWTVVDPVEHDGGSSVMYLPGKFMKSGAAINPDYPQTNSHPQTFVLDMTVPQPAWRQTASMSFPRTQHNLTMLPDGNVLVTGGAQHSYYFDLNAGIVEAEMWNPTTETYTTMASNPKRRIYHSTALLLPDARVLSMGGEGTGDVQFTGEIYSPPYLFKGPRPTMTGVPAVSEYGATMTIQTAQAASIAKVSMIRLGSVTHAFNSEQRFLPLSFTTGSGTLTAQLPGNTNLATPGYYMVFIVDTNGVPSVASITRFPSPTEDSSPPSQPTNLVANGSVGAASLSWTASGDNNAVTAYDVHRSTSNPFTPSLATKIGSTTTATTYLDSGVPAGTYSYRVIARDAAGNTSPPSDIATAIVSPDGEAPSPPPTLQATVVSESRIDLTWGAATDNIGVTGYRILRDGNQIATSATTSYSNTGLTPSTPYVYTVTAVDAAGNVSLPSPAANATTLNAPPPSSGLVAAWAFDENGGLFTADASGNGFTGTLTNNPAWVAGKYGSALSFNATDDGNDANDPKVALGQTINVPNLPFTFSAWVNPASYADWRAIFSKRNSPSASNMRCDVGLSSSTGRVYVSTGSTFRSFTYAPPLNAWTHVAVVAEATGTKLYVGGVLNQTLTAVTLGTGTTASTAIGGTGSGPGGNDDPYKGLLDDVRLYSRALTAAEITADMNTPAGAPDTEFPTVSLTAPAAGTVSGTVSVTADASDNVVVAGVQFRLDGVALGAEDTAAPYAVSWNTLTASNGSHDLTAVARDAAGNTTTSGSVTVTVSNPPTLTITAPAAGSTVVGTTVPVSYTVSGDLTGVDHVHFQLDGLPEVMDLSMDGSYPLTNVAAGSHVLNGYLVLSTHVKIPGTDAAPVSFTTTVPDTVFPTVSLTAPAAGSTVSGTITVTADASDNLGVAGVQFRVGATNLLPEDTSAPYSVVFNTATVANGVHSLTAVARDAAGNSTTSAPLSITVNNAPPPTGGGLVAAYGFDEITGPTTADASGNGFTGTLANSPTRGAGKNGNGLTFNATDDANDANDPKVTLGQAIDVPALPFTFSAWVNPASFADWRAIFSKRNSPSASNMRFDVGLASGTGRVYVATGSTFRTFLYTPPIGVWTHVTVVAEATGTKLYVNGLLQQTVAAVTLGTNATANAAIGGTGSGPSGNDDPYKGSLDDVRLYSRALTLAEIQSDRDTPVGTAPAAVAQTQPLVASSAAELNEAPPAAPPILRVFPNPFRSGTRIEARGGYEVNVFDVNGRKVRTWASREVLSVDWDGTDRDGRRLPAGIYFVKAGPRIIRATLLK